jgi:hypothetical protein
MVGPFDALSNIRSSAVRTAVLARTCRAVSAVASNGDPLLDIADLRPDEADAR